MAGNPDFNAILSTTLQNYQPTLVDNIFKDLVLLNHLNSRGRVVVEEGGTSIVEPLMYAANGTVSSYTGYDPISLTPQDGISAAEYQWKQIAGSIAISGIEEAKNRGTEAIIKLLNAKIMQTEMSLKSDLNTMLFGDGTGNSSKDFNGLENIVGTANNTVGGIDASTDSWWNPYVDNAGATLSLSSMSTVYNNASKGNDTPDLIVTTEPLFAKYESLLTNNVRYQDVEKANAGFTNLMFKQTPVVFDFALDAQSATPNTNAPMYFINTKYLKLVGMNGHWFNTTEFQNGTVAGKDARYALVMAFGELTCSNRSRQGYLNADA
jgi:hypothetical protein